MGIENATAIVLATDWARVVAAGLGISGAACLAALCAGLIHLQRHQWLAWRASLRQVGWLPAALSGAAVVALILVLKFAPLSAPGHPPADVATSVESIVPLAISIQVALLFSPADEPALEVLLAAPRPVYWIMLERYLLAFALQAVVAVLGTALTFALIGRGEPMLATVRWLPTAIGMSGLTAFVTIRSRRANVGMIIAILLWFVALVGRDLIVPAEVGGRPFPPPLDAIQPALWMIHPYLDPGQLSGLDYAINRIALTGIGCVLTALAVIGLRDSERLLLGKRVTTRLDKER